MEKTDRKKSGFSRERQQHTTVGYPGYEKNVEVGGPHSLTRNHGSHTCYHQPTIIHGEEKTLPGYLG